MQRETGVQIQPPADFWRRISTQLVLLAALVLAVGGAVLRVFDFSHAPDYGEGTILAAIERLQEEPFSPRWLDGPVLTLSPYGPAYYRVVEAVTRVLPWKHSLLPGRLVSLAATLLMATLIGAIVGRRGRSIELGMLSALVLLLSPVVHAWGTPHRVDPMAVLLVLLAYLAIGLRRFGVVLSAVAVVLASLVKQNMIVAAAVLLLCLLLRRRFKAAMVYALLVAGLGAGTWGLLNDATGGYFLATAVKGHLGAMWPQQGLLHLYWFLATPGALAASILVAWLFVERPTGLRRSVYAIGFVVSTAVAAVLSCKEGASYAYFFEATVLGTLVIGLYGLPAVWSLHPGRASAMAVVLALVLIVPEARWLRHRGLRLDTSPYNGARISACLAPTTPAYVLADGQYLDAVLQAGFTPLVNDPFLFRQLVGNGTLSPARVVERMKRGDVAYLVLKRSLAGHRKHLGDLSQKWPRELIEAMEEHYVLEVADGEDLFIYRHRNKQERTKDEGRRTKDEGEGKPERR